MKVTFELKDTEQLRPLLNFIQELTGKDFKQIKVKQVCSKMELTEIDVKVKTPKENNKTFVSGKKITSVNYDMPIINLYNKIFSESDPLNLKPNNFSEYNCEIKDEEVLKFPGLEKERDDLSNIIDALNISEYEKSIHGERLRCHPNCVEGFVYNGKGSIHKCEICNKPDIFVGKEVDECLSEILRRQTDPNQNNMYFGSASVIPNKQWIDEND